VPEPVEETEPILEAREEQGAPMQLLNDHSQEYVFSKLKTYAEQNKDDSEHVQRPFVPRKLSSPAGYEESNLSKEFEVEKPKEQFDIEDEESAAKVDEEDEMMRKA
jgi:hypothetical protein